jgi:hypothetical protein
MAAWLWGLDMRALLLSAVVALLVACATPLPPATFNDRAAQVMLGVTTLRQANTALLVAGKISLEEDQARQGRLDSVRAAVEAARRKYPTNADEATLLIVEALNKLAEERAKQ